MTACEAPLCNCVKRYTMPFLRVSRDLGIGIGLPDWEIYTVSPRDFDALSIE